MKTATVVCTTKACRLGMPTYCSTARKFASGTQHQFDQIPRELKSYFCDFHQRFFWSQRMPIKMFMPNPFSWTKNPPLNTNPNSSFHKKYVRKCANEDSSVVVWIINGIKWSNFSQTYSIAYRSGKKILHSGFQKETKLQYRQVIGFFKQILWKTTKIWTKIVAVTLKKLLHRHRNLKKERGKTDRPPPSTNSASEEPEHRAMMTTA
jgi:hypothetical protein